MRAARSVSRGPTWVSWLNSLNWASWPRTYVAGLFDIPNTDPAIPALVPVADWSRVRIRLDGEPLLLRLGETLRHRRSLNMRGGVLLAEWVQRTPAGITATIRTRRLLSFADRDVAEDRLISGDPLLERLKQRSPAAQETPGDAQADQND